MSREVVLRFDTSDLVAFHRLMWIWGPAEWIGRLRMELDFKLLVVLILISALITAGRFGHKLALRYAPW